MSEPECLTPTGIALAALDPTLPERLHEHFDPEEIEPVHQDRE